MNTFGLIVKGSLDVLNEYSSLQSNLLKIQSEGVRHILSRIKLLQNLIFEEQFLHFQALLQNYEEAQTRLLDIQEKAQPYLGDNVIDDFSCDSSHVLKRKEEAKEIRASIFSGCSEVSDPASLMKLVRSELIDNREFVASSKIVSKLKKFKECAGL